MSREVEQPIVIERREPKKKYSLSLEEVRQRAKEGIVIPIYRTLPSDLDTPVTAYLKLSSDNRRGGEDEAVGFSPSILLESIVGGERVGRYSYICTNPKEGIRVTANQISTLNYRDGTVTTQSGERIDPLKAIQEKVKRKVDRTVGVPPFSGGYVGYLGYEVASAFEEKVPKSNPDVLRVPEAMLFDFDNVVVFDNVRNELKIVGNIDVGDLSDLDSRYQETTSKIDEIANRMNRPITVKTKTSEEKVGDRSIRSNFTKEEYMNVVRKIIEYIEAGDVIQVVNSQRWKRETSADPFSIYSALRRFNPSPFMAYFDFGDFQIIAASPELLLKVENGHMITNPIAGTRPRGKTQEEDEHLAKELQENEKENAEHNMLLDLGRNDIGRVAKPGTVTVPRIKEVERFATVMHLTSEVQGDLQDKYTSLDALRSVFPAGTVSGAPKIRAMQIINEVEKEQRGPYAGVIGYVDYSGNLEMAITIRTMVFIDGIVYIQAGGGIVYDSGPEAEHKETVDKSQGSLRAIVLAEEEY